MNALKTAKILSWIAVGGVGLTGVLSALGANKAAKKKTVKEKVICYMPAAVAGIGTAACIITGNGISTKEIVTLTATAGYLASNRDRLERAIRENSDDELAEELIQEARNEAPKAKITIEETGHGNEVFFDAYSGRIFKSSIRKVEEAQRKLQEMHDNGTYLALNDYYELLGIQATEFGCRFGWPPEDTGWCDGPLKFRNVEAVESRDGFDWIIETWNYPTEVWLEV